MAEIFGLIIIASLAAQEIATPNYRHPQESVIGLAQSNQAVVQARTANAMSPSYNAPTRLQENSIPSTAEIIARFDRGVLFAKEQDASSYLSVGPDYFDEPGCQFYASHPRGVKRKADDQYNGVSSLLLCNGVALQIEISDFSQETSPAMQASLPNNGMVMAISGGNMVSSFAETDDGRIRQDHYAIGKNFSVRVVAQSNKAIFQDEVRVLASRIIARVLANPPGTS